MGDRSGGWFLGVGNGRDDTGVPRRGSKVGVRYESK